jgi:hypothetical protein
LFVEYIEVVFELLMSALQRADAIVDIPASKAALASDANRTEDSGYMLGGRRVEWMDHIHQENIAVPLSGLPGLYRRRYDSEKGDYLYREVVCKGYHRLLSVLNT